jgi:hypothetical protein
VKGDFQGWRVTSFLLQWRREGPSMTTEEAIAMLDAYAYAEEREAWAIIKATLARVTAERDRLEWLAAVFAWSDQGLASSDDKTLPPPREHDAAFFEHIAKVWGRCPGIEPWIAIVRQVAAGLDAAGGEA